MDASPDYLAASQSNPAALQASTSQPISPAVDSPLAPVSPAGTYQYHSPIPEAQHPLSPALLSQHEAQYRRPVSPLRSPMVEPPPAPVPPGRAYGTFSGEYGGNEEYIPQHLHKVPVAKGIFISIGYDHRETTINRHQQTSSFNIMTPLDLLQEWLLDSQTCAPSGARFVNSDDSINTFHDSSRALRGTPRWPSIENIRLALRWLGSGAVSGSSLLLYFRGHIDHYGTAYDASGRPIPPSFFSDFVQGLPRGATATLLFDGIEGGAPLALHYGYTVPCHTKRSTPWAHRASGPLYPQPLPHLLNPVQPTHTHGRVLMFGITHSGAKPFERGTFNGHAPIAMAVRESARQGESIIACLHRLARGARAGGATARQVAWVMSSYRVDLRGKQLSVFSPALTMAEPEPEPHTPQACPKQRRVYVTEEDDFTKDWHKGTVCAHCRLKLPRFVTHYGGRLYHTPCFNAIRPRRVEAEAAARMGLPPSGAGLPVGETVTLMAVRRGETYLPYESMSDAPGGQGWRNLRYDPTERFL